MYNELFFLSPLYNSVAILVFTWPTSPTLSINHAVCSMYCDSLMTTLCVLAIDNYYYLVLPQVDVTVSYVS